MKFLKGCLIVVATLVLIGGAGYLYASSGVKSKPGYAELVMPKGSSVNALVSVKLGPGGVGPARWVFDKIVEYSDHEIDAEARVVKDVLADLNGVQLRVYEVADNREAFDVAIAESVAALQAQNWQTLAKVYEDDERVVVMHNGNNTEIDGVSVMVSTPENAVFINLIGPFDGQAIADAVSQLH